MADETDATEAAIALAAEQSLDLAAVTGTGAHGRITKADVEAHLAAQPADERPAPAVRTAQPAPHVAEPKTVQVRAVVSFGVFVDGRPISAAGGSTVRLPAAVAAQLVAAGQAEVVEEE